MSGPEKVLFAHTPKAAGLHLIAYFRDALRYPVITSQNRSARDTWVDFTLDELRTHLGAEAAFLHSHVLAYGWSALAFPIPPEPKADIVAALGAFRDRGWFTFTFVRHPGELLCSFYHYVLDYHARGETDIVAAHVPLVHQTIDAFVSEHCERELIPDYWRALDVAGESSEASFIAFFSRFFDHAYRPGLAPTHRSSNPGYAHYCATGGISPETRARIERSANLERYLEIRENGRRLLGT